MEGNIRRIGGAIGTMNAGSLEQTVHDHQNLNDHRIGMPLTMNLDGDGQDLLKWIGLGIAIAAAILSNLGVNIQKLSHLQEDTRPIEEQRKYYTRPLWIFGMLLVVLGSIGDFEALGFSPQALVASVGGGCTVLANVFIAHRWLGQSLSKMDLYGTFLIIVGVVLSTTTNEPDDEMSLENLERQFVQVEFVVYISLMFVMIIAIFAEIHRIRKLPHRDHAMEYRKIPYLFATISGIFGSFSVLLAKCASELLLLTFQGKNQFIYVTTYIFVGGMILTLVLQTDLLNRAIMSGDTLSVFPVFQCFWIGGSVIGGVVFYQKFTRFSFYEWIALPLALTFGIYLLSQHEEHEKDHLNQSADTNVNIGSVMPLSPNPSGRRSNASSCSSYGTLENQEEWLLSKENVLTKWNNRQ